MRPVLTDRMAVIGIVAGLVLWVCCLTILWGWAYDASGTFALRTTLIIFASCWFCLWRRERIISIARRFLAAFHLSEIILLDKALDEQLGSSRDDVNHRMYILAASSALAGVCFVFSTVWILASAAIAARIGSSFLLSDWIWSLMEWVSLIAGSLPVALGLAAVCFAVKVVRESGGRDVFGAAFRDLMWGIAVGLAGFAVSWWFGANLIYLVFSIAIGILIVAVTAISRVELATHPRKKLLPFGPPPKGSELVIACTYAALGLVLIFQMRLLGDIFSLSLTRRILWVFLAVLLLGYFLDRLDRKNKPPSRMQNAGAVLGLAAGLLAQATEWILCIGLDSGTWIAVTLGVATQIPLAALAAMVISYQRRNFAFCGGKAGSYFAALTGGLALAVVIFMFIGWLSWGWILLIILAGGGVIAGGIDGAIQTSKTAERIQWIVFSAVLSASLVVGLGATLGLAGETTGPMQPGQWLSSRCELRDVRDESGKKKKEFYQSGLLPEIRNLRSELITDCLAGVFERRKGKWWIAATSAADLPARDRAPELTEDIFDDENKNATVWTRIYAAGVNPQPPTVPKKALRWPPLSYSDPDYFRYARLNFVADVGCDFYDGVFLAPIPADHPQAWRCYNDRILRRCRRLTEGGYDEWVEELGRYFPKTCSGLMVLRTQVGPDCVRRALSVARTYYNVVGSGWAIVAFKPGLTGMDILLVGPGESLLGDDKKDILKFLRKKVSQASGQLYLVPIEELWSVYVGVEPIFLFNPPGERLDDTPKLQGLKKWLENRTVKTDNGG